MVGGGAGGRVRLVVIRRWIGHRRGRDDQELLAPLYGWFPEGFDTADLKDVKELLDALA